MKILKIILAAMVTATMLIPAIPLAYLYSIHMYATKMAKSMTGNDDTH